MTNNTQRRLDGLEPDNLLAFMALLGLLRVLESADRGFEDQFKLRPRASWDLASPPVRPVLHLAREASNKELAALVAHEASQLADYQNFENRKDLDYSRGDARKLLMQSIESADSTNRHWPDILAALMCDVAVKEDKGSEDDVVMPTPFCLLFGQGHQHFLDRLGHVPAQAEPPPRGRQKNASKISAAECIAEALFSPWTRQDKTFSFRWDPDEAVRYALMAGNPTDDAYKTKTQHGANRLAALGLAALTVVPILRANKVRIDILGGVNQRGFTMAWPIWRPPATLTAIRGLLGHPNLRKENGLQHLGVEYVLVARRISIAKFMNFSRAQILTE